jgi:nitroreductase
MTGGLTGQTVLEVGAMTWLDQAAFEAAVAAAVLAPSMHNSQPWRFRLGPDHVDLLVDPARRLPVSDATGWASRVGCGAALFNLRLALAAEGRPAVVRVQPDPGDPDLLARLTPDRPRPALPVESRLYQAIGRRHSNRAPFLDKPVPAAARSELMAAARAENGSLNLLIGPVAVEVAAEMVRVADQALRRDDAYQAELTAWTRRARASAADDGVPTAAGGPAPQPHELLARRDFSGRELAGNRDYEREPLLAVIGTTGDWPADQVQAGQVLQRVLLTATDLGLAASMFSQPIEVPGIRAQLRRALSRQDTPQMLLRFGYATSTPRSPRRPVSEVLVN